MNQLPIDPDEVQAILEARAAELARPADDGAGPQGRTFVVVQVGPERYGIDIAAIGEVRPVSGVTRIPSIAPHWLGVANLRGALVPILDLERYLGGVSSGTPAVPWPVVVVASGSTRIGLRVESIAGVRTIADVEIGPSLVHSESHAPIHAGLTTDLVAILDITALLSDPGLEVRDEMS